MEQGTIWINEHSLIIIGGLSFLVILLMVLVILFQGKVKKLQDKYDFFMQGKDTNIEGLLTDTLEQLQLAKKELKELQTDHQQLQEQVNGCIQHVKMERYDAFDAMGGELSYSILMEDKNKNGLIMTSIYGRDESRCYAKLLKNGQAQTPLAEEEKKLL